jgi:O-antigen ligase
VAVAAWLATGFRGTARGPWLAGNPLLAPCVLFVLVNVESLAWSQRPTDTLEFIVQLVEIVVLLPLLFASIPRSVEKIQRALGVYIGLTCVMAAAVTLVYVPYALSGNLEGQNLPGFNKNAIGSFVAAGLVLTYALWLTETRPRMRRLLSVAAVIEFAGLLATVSRGSMIGAFFAVLGVSLLLRRRRLFTFGLAAVASLFFLTVIGVHSGVDRSLSGSYDSSVVRSYSFANAIEKIEDRPLLGVGGGTYLDYIEELEFFLPDPNNMFLLTWAELGIIGIGALLFLLFRYGRLLFAARNLPHSSRGLAVGTGCVTLSFLIHFQLDVTWTRGTTSLAFAMMGLLLALERLAADGSGTMTRGLETPVHPDRVRVPAPLPS